MKHEVIFTPVDIRQWSRGEMFYYFSKMAPTGYSLTVDVDITHMRDAVRSAGRSFFPSFLWLVTKTLNEQQEFRTADADGKTGFYNFLTPMYAAFHDDDKTFSLMWTEFDDDYKAFHDAYEYDKKTYGGNHGVLSKKDILPPPNAYTVSCLPWISFGHFAVHSYDKPYYFPSVEAGKFYEKDGKTLMPLSITCHHAATDGYHVSRFLEKFQSEADSFEKYLQEK